MCEDVQVNFKFCKGSHCSCYYIGGQTIDISLHEIAEDVERDKLSFAKAFSETMSHELLHHIVYELEGSKASEWIDVISARKLYKKGKKFSIKDWIGGIYGYKEVR